MGFVKRRANTKAKVRVEHFDELKKLYLLEINNVVVEMDEIPSELVEPDWYKLHPWSIMDDGGRGV